MTRVLTVWLFLSPVKEVVDHVNGRLPRVDTGIRFLIRINKIPSLKDLDKLEAHREMNWVGVQSNRLPIPIIMRTKRLLHIRHRYFIIWF